MERVEIDAKEAQNFFGKLGVKFAFNTAYKSEAMVRTSVDIHRL